MRLVCKHCGTSFAAAGGVGEFCCAGCRHVHELICSEGLDTFYSLQDRVGRPVGELSSPHAGGLSGLQSEAERASDTAGLTLGVAGMSCMGCVWLVERIARRQAGCVQAQASLQANRLTLRWRVGQFDLPALGGQLAGFGYHLSERSTALRGWSPLAWRSLLFGSGGQFAGVGGVLAVLGQSAAVASLLDLLILAVAVISMVVGLAVPVAGSSLAEDACAPLRWFICAGLLLLLPTQFAPPVSVVDGFCRLFWRCCCGRMLHVCAWQGLLRRADLPVCVQAGGRCWQRLLCPNGLMLVPLVCALAVFGLKLSVVYGTQFAAAVCLVFSLYPVSIAARYTALQVWQVSGLAMGWLGLLLSSMVGHSLWLAVCWMLFSGSCGCWYLWFGSDAVLQLPSGMLEGLTSGFILSLSLFPGTVWVVRLGVVGRWPHVVAACSALASRSLPGCVWRFRA